MGSKGRMRDPPGILRWNASYWLESSLCEKQYKCHLLTRSHISSIFRQFPSLLVQLKARCASRGSLRLSENSSIYTTNSISSAGGFETFPKRWYNFIVPTRRNGLSHAGGFETCSRSLWR